MEKITYQKNPTQPSYNPQHKQKCETFVSTRLDKYCFSWDCTTYGTTSYKQKYETVVFLRLVLRLVRYNPAYNPMVLKYNPRPKFIDHLGGWGPLPGLLLGSVSPRAFTVLQEQPRSTGGAARSGPGVAYNPLYKRGITPNTTPSK